MEILRQTFEERLSEIDTYLDFLSALEAQTQSGPPRVGEGGVVISATQQRILYSSVYLQLYNLVEATITKCIEAVTSAVVSGGNWEPKDLSEQLKREWVRYLAKSHTELNFENRLKHSLELCDHLINAQPISDMKIDKGGGGNWDDEEIYRFSTRRLGLDLVVSNGVTADIKRPFKNEKGALALIVQLRNDLAHGEVSFAECGADVSAEELRDLNNRVAVYLKEVVGSFEKYLAAHEFLSPSRRPTVPA